MKRILFVSLFFISQFTFAQNVVDVSNGNRAMALIASDIGINCTSEDKAITVYGSVPGDSRDGNLEIKIKGKKFHLKDDRSFGGRTTISAVTNVEQGVFTVAAKNKVSSDDAIDLSLYAFPKSMTGNFANRFFRVSFEAQMKFSVSRASCEDGCIALSVEAEQENKGVFEVVKLTCMSGNY